jgi:hypothetical protein
VAYSGTMPIFGIVFFIGKAKESISRKYLCLDVGKKEDKICHSPMIDKAK